MFKHVFADAILRFDRETRRAKISWANFPICNVDTDDITGHLSNTLYVVCGTTCESYSSDCFCALPFIIYEEFLQDASRSGHAIMGDPPIIA